MTRTTHRFALLFLIGVLASGISAASAPMRYLITEHGAVGDGVTVNTQTIQDAIDGCAAAGGGVVVVPKGVFISGALFFKAGVNLELQKDAVLKSTNQRADFPLIYTRWEGTERYWISGFLNFIGVDDVTLTGEGTIDGSGLDWGSAKRPRKPNDPLPEPSAAELTAAAAPLPRPEEVYPLPLPTTAAIHRAVDPNSLPRINAAGIAIPGADRRPPPPRTIVFQNCTKVRVSGVRLKNQACWGLVFIYCRGVVAEDLTIHIDDYIPSSDGIDIDSTEDVRISRCDIACTDDNISIKSGKDADGLRVNRPSQNIVISDCTFGTGGGVAMGSEVSGSIRHVLVQRCAFTGTGNAARIKSQPSRGGVIEDIEYRDFQLTDVNRAFSFELAWRMLPPLAPAAKVLTQVRDIRLVNITGTVRTGGLIAGLDGSSIRGLKFENCQLTAQTGLVLAAVQDPDLAGLRIKVAEGESVLWRK